MQAQLFPTETDPLRTWRRLASERTALVDRGAGRRWSYREMDVEADLWAALLRGLGVGRGDRVAVLAGNRSEVIHLFFACGRIGAALVPLNWRLQPAELSVVLGDAAPRLLFVEAAFREAAEEALRLAGGAPDPPRPVLLDLDHDGPRLLAADAAPAPPVEPGPEDPLLVLYTSGSTGRPKGAVLPRRQLFYNAVATTTAWELGSADVAPISTPLFHTGGWNVFATPLWHRGGTVVLLDGFAADDFLRALREERCTMALTVPTQLLLLMESPLWGVELPALRTFVSGGAPCPASVVERVRAAGYRMHEGYGLTECGPNCFAISDEEALARPGSVGWPVPFLEMRLVDEEGRDVPDGEPGELWLRGPQRFSGYLNDPARTAEALAEGGWLRTGDLAVRDADDAYRICGRRKEMFISGGENVFPGEVEAALADCQGVAESVVIGMPDALWGEVGCAFVTPRAGASLTETDLLAHARTRLAGYKVPKRIVFVDSVPRLGSGKPDRRALTTLLSSRVET